MATSTAARRICVIGAGPSGMSTLYHLTRNLPDIPEIVCFEKQSTWGGMWNTSWHTGVDEFGEPCHASMYKDLRINAPKECCEIPEYTYNSHFGHQSPSYLPREAVRSYLEGRWTKMAKMNLKDLIQFNTIVRTGVYDDDKREFKLVTNNLKTGELKEDSFSHLVVATGIFHRPKAPHIPGMETFQGRISHSHDFRSGYEYKGQRLLVIGCGYSGEDVTMHAMRGGAKQVIMSWDKKAPQLQWPDGVQERPKVQRMEGNKIVFFDGTTEVVDSIVFCTGYLNHFPFLESRLKLQPTSSYYNQELYRSSLFLPAANRQMFYVGAQMNFYTFPFLDCSASWTSRYIMGQLPEEEEKSDTEMQDSAEHWHTRSKLIANEHDVVTFNKALFASLAEDTGYCKEPLNADVLFRKWLDHRQENIATFRSYNFHSLHADNITASALTAQTPAG